jgi:hypothetical protein
LKTPATPVRRNERELFRPRRGAHRNVRASETFNIYAFNQTINGRRQATFKTETPVKTRNFVLGNVATMTVLAVTLTTVFVGSASADVYHHPYHRPYHRVVAHRYVHPVSHRVVRRDDEHPHH